MGFRGSSRGDFVRPRVELLSAEESAELRRRMVPIWCAPPEGCPQGPYEEANRGMSLTEAVEQIRRKPRSERLSGEFNTPELRRRDADG